MKHGAYGHTIIIVEIKDRVGKPLHESAPIFLLNRRECLRASTDCKNAVPDFSEKLATQPGFLVFVPVEAFLHVLHGTGPHNQALNHCCEESFLAPLPR